MLDPQKQQRMLRFVKLKIPISEIARKLNISRTTIYAYLKNPDRGIAPLEIRTRKSKLDIFDLSFIKKLFVEFGFNSNSVTKIINSEFKKRLPNMSVDPSTVRRFAKSRLPDLFTYRLKEINPFYVEPGQQIQIDFLQRDFLFVGDDRPSKLYIFIAVYSFSRHGFIKICDDMKQSSWYLSLIECLSDNGLPLEILCDNDKSLVLKNNRNGRTYNPSFLQLCNAVGIRPHACRPRNPQTKGRVERYGRHVGESALKFARYSGGISTKSQLQNFLNEWIIKDEKDRTVEIGGKKYTIAEAWKIESEYLKRSDEPFENLFVYSGEIQVKDNGYIYLFSVSKNLGYRERGNFYYCYVKYDGTCILISQSANKIYFIDIPKENLDKFNVDTKPPVTDPVEELESYPGDAYFDLGKIADIMENENDG